MASIISGNNLGLSTTSLALLGAQIGFYKRIKRSSGTVGTVDSSGQ